MLALPDSWACCCCQMETFGVISSTLIDSGRHFPWQELFKNKYIKSIATCFFHYSFKFICFLSEEKQLILVPSMT